jgi:hypothetical protein
MTADSTRVRCLLYQKRLACGLKSPNISSTKAAKITKFIMDNLNVHAVKIPACYDHYLRLTVMGLYNQENVHEKITEQHDPRAGFIELNGFSEAAIFSYFEGDHRQD